MREIQQAVERLRRLDDDYNFIMLFLNKPSEHFHFIDLTIKQEISKQFSPESPNFETTGFDMMNHRYDAIMNKINDQWWGKIYPAHETHFHKNFKDFCNCPTTCLTEILDCLDKILVGS
jgi:hypothetical protein